MMSRNLATLIGPNILHKVSINESSQVEKMKLKKMFNGNSPRGFSVSFYMQIHGQHFEGLR